jgi:hypothetical protein
MRAGTLTRATLPRGLWRRGTAAEPSAWRCTRRPPANGRSATRWGRFSTTRSTRSGGRQGASMPRAALLAAAPLAATLRPRTRHSRFLDHERPTNTSFATASHGLGRATEPWPIRDGTAPESAGSKSGGTPWRRRRSRRAEPGPRIRRRRYSLYTGEGLPFRGVHAEPAGSRRIGGGALAAVAHVLGKPGSREPGAPAASRRQKA